MKVVLGTPLPTKFLPLSEDIVIEGDVKIPGSRLCAKVIVFSHRKALHYFWSKILKKGDLGRNALAAVNALAYHEGHITKEGKEVQTRVVYDPKYYCIMGFTLENLGMNIICHESVHAAYAFIKRSRRSPWDACIEDFDEEKVAYPTGFIASELNIFFSDHSIYEIAETYRKYRR